MRTHWQQFLAIPGYTWFNTYNTLSELGEDGVITKSESKLWLERKLDELNYVTVVGSLLASVVATSVSWPGVNTSPWIVQALWVTSITFVVAAVVMAFQQAASLGLLLIQCQSEKGKALNATHLFENETTPSWWSVLALQAPVQLLSYCFFSYSIGLIVHIMWQGFRGGESKGVALFYISTLACGVLFYIVVSVYSRRAFQYKDENQTRTREEEGRCTPS